MISVHQEDCSTHEVHRRQNYDRRNWSYGDFCDFWLAFAKIWLPWQRPLDPCNHKCLLWIGWQRKAPVISNHIPVISRRNVIFVPKLVAMVTPLCPLCSVVSHTNSRWHKPYLKTKLCMDMSLTTKVVAIFVIFWPTLAKIWLPWQRSLDPCNQKCLLWIGWPQKPLL